MTVTVRTVTVRTVTHTGGHIHGHAPVESTVWSNTAKEEVRVEVEVRLLLGDEEDHAVIKKKQCNCIIIATYLT